MPNINWKTELSLGNMLSIATMIVGLSIGWATMAATLEANAKGLDALDARLSAQEQKFEQFVTLIATDKVAQTTLLTEVRTDLRLLRQAFEQFRQEATR